MGIVRESFIIFKNWYEAIEKLPQEYQLECYKALAHYGLNGEKPQGISPITDAMLTSFSVGMENSILRYNACVENGKKGGAPKGNQNARKKTGQEELVEDNQKQLKTTENNQEQPKTIKNNLNVNVNDNVNDIKLVNEKLNIFNDYTSAGACERVPLKSLKERQPYLNYYAEYFDWCFSDSYRKIGYEIIDTMIEAKEQAASDSGLIYKQQHYTIYSFANLIAKIDCDKFRSIVTQLAFKEDIKNRPVYILGCIISTSKDSSCKVSKEEMDKFVNEIEEVNTIE